MAHYKTEITAILNAGGLCSRQEYERIRKEVIAKAPCDVISFGLGHDSEWLAKLNKGGRTVFIENNRKWIEANEGKGLEIVFVDYNSRELNDGTLKPAKLLEMPELRSLGLFDVVWVDSPIGRTQGRMKSIYMGFQLRKENGVVLVHDYNRATEKMYTDAFLGDLSLEVVDKLAVCK